ncbi:DUF2075 domain-containing protein [Variovorax sp. J22G73]|uniref:DUF2075 domain-containing protein n=1 Tax=unclassified Variovorax TaxID=663243 RepID=UPI000D5E2BE8|nr:MULTISPECIES: DUF2075 domain-containing protein [unclassified Variovorax]MDM0008074.1 DUF2075 domain-containing protein [Variovorax sp. J22R203]MDM0100304.1 DUF2075 domain-containing protein [Variovorax sp. J22G73]
MIVYEADKKQFLSDNNDRDIEDVILAKYFSATGRKVPAAEMRAWRDSLGYMSKVLSDSEIPNDVGVAVELHIPQSSKRIDISLTGRGHDNTKNVVIVELKQWDKVKSSMKDALVSTYLGGGHREVVHPSYQAWSYASLMEGFNEAVYSGGIAVQACAYLHNYERDGVIDSPHYADYIAKAPLFLRGETERGMLRNFIKQHIKFGDPSVLYELANGRIRPSKALSDSLAGLLKGNAEFILIDDQKEVYEHILAAGRSASSTNPKVVIVEGGPGTGKTVLAINALVTLMGAGLNCKYVSKNAAPRRVYETKLVGTMKRTHYVNLFTGSGGFINTPADQFDVLIVDEAHRLNEKSGLYGNLGENQVKELIAAAKCTVFFIDEDQRVALSDIGTKQTIRDFGVGKGAEVSQHELASQFRCSGSDGYIAWLDDTLGVRETANKMLTPAEFDFQVFSTPDQLHASIAAKNTTGTARVVAGYCWPWTSKKDPKAFDIVIGSYRKRWNLDVDGSLWIIAPNSINEVGCIHTCQGLEVDYIGVIIGPDLIVRDGHVRTEPTARDRFDKTLRGHKTRAKTNPKNAAAAADLIIKNTYRTLMTRGMKGCYVYCSDEETALYFRDRLSPGALAAVFTKP